jgi:phosphoribosylformylglycinamidine (FGAM) synthase-like enzyme
MDADILCTLLAQRIPPEQFQLWGTDIHWMDEKYDTPENRAIVADVTKNYDNLAEEYQGKMDKEKARAEAIANLTALDFKSIRSIAEWVAMQPNAPARLLEYETQKTTERAKLK